MPHQDGSPQPAVIPSSTSPTAEPAAAWELSPARVRVRYADTDAMGVVYYANYLAFFETGRVEAMRQIGADYAGVVSRGVHLAVVEASVRYRRPAYFDDVLLVAAHAEDLRRVRFTFRYHVVRETDQELIATGQSVHACVNATSLRPVQIPAWLRHELNRLCKPT
ncbi:MAG: acyl-CoA thioesterase [Chloroflexota bacterium]|nr:acyl-CoA thioesterase [Chloroflexota bacterium]